jgi:retinol dehydrogenase 12
MNGKIVVVTGATAGIGRITAAALAGKGAHVWLIGRNPQKLSQTEADLRRVHPAAQLHSVRADLSIQAEVRAAAAELTRSLPRIDVLLNNAGAIFDKRELTRDGIEATWALNHLAYFLLTQELLPLLKSAPAARVVNVSSAAHMIARNGIDWDDVQGARKYSSWTAYGQSKLANILFSNELARRTGLASNALHPGTVRTQFGGNNDSVLWKVIRALSGMFSISEEDGARTSIYVASSPEVEGVHGRYFDKCKPVAPSTAARDSAAAERLWAMSIAMTALR